MQQILTISSGFGLEDKRTIFTANPRKSCFEKFQHSTTQRNFTAWLSMLIFMHSQIGGEEINITPLQPENLSTPQSGLQTQYNDVVKIFITGIFRKGNKTLGLFISKEPFAFVMQSRKRYTINRISPFEYGDTIDDCFSSHIHHGSDYSQIMKDGSLTEFGFFKVIHETFDVLFGNQGKRKSSKSVLDSEFVSPIIMGPRAFFLFYFRKEIAFVEIIKSHRTDAINEFACLVSIPSFFILLTKFRERLWLVTEFCSLLQVCENGISLLCCPALGSPAKGILYSFSGGVIANEETTIWFSSEESATMLSISHARKLRFYLDSLFFFGPHLAPHCFALYGHKTTLIISELYYIFYKTTQNKIYMGIENGLKIPGPQGCAGSIPALGTKTKRTGYDTNPHPFTLQNKPPHACSCNCKCKQEGGFFFPPSFLSPPPSAPQSLRTRRHVFLHTLWAGSAYFPWGVGGPSRASGGHPGSLSISAG